MMDTNNAASDEELFITQNTFKSDSNSGNDTETIIETVLDMEHNFELKNPLFSDISDAGEDVTEGTKQSLKTIDTETPKGNRFAKPISDLERDEQSKSRFSKTTDAKSKWAVNLFNGWMESRQQLHGDRDDIQHITGDLLTLETATLDYALGAFIFELRRENGEEYRGNTLYEIIVAIQHFLRENGRFVTLLDDVEFEGMRAKLDKRMKELASKGIGIVKQQACVISMDDEEKMWRNGILGSDTPDKLRNTLLYLLGLNFALRGGQEHYNLRHGNNSQLSIGEDSSTGRKYLHYTEDVSKCNPGGIQHRKIARKNTKAYENTGNPERCVVALYQKYIGLRPPNGKCEALYLRSLSKPTDKQWYADVRIGINLMSKVVKTLCGQAGLKGFYTNHSLRATAATRMYEADISEQIICEKTGHRSDSVRNYKRTSTVQQQHASDIVQGIKREREICDENNNVGRNIKITKGDITIDIPV